MKIQINFNDGNSLSSHRIIFFQDVTRQQGSINDIG